MTEVLILRTNFTHEVKRINVDCEILAKELHCNWVERLVTHSGYTENGHTKHLQCWADEEGFCTQQPQNPYAPLLVKLGQYITFGVQLYGDVVVHNTNNKHKHHIDISQYIVDLVRRFEASDNHDRFLSELK
jgi:hypothetical protein